VARSNQRNWRRDGERVALNLLYVIHYPIFGGPHNIALRLAEPMSQSGWRISVLCPDEPGTAADRLRMAGVDVLTVPLHRIRARADPMVAISSVRGTVTDVRRIRRIIQENSIDVVLLAGLVNIQAAVAARREAVPLIWQLIDTRTPVPVNAAFMVIVKRLADVVMTTGPDKVARAHPGVRSFGQRLVPFFPPVDVTVFRPDNSKRSSARAKLGLSDDDVVIGNASNLNPQKGHRTFIRAAHELRKSIPGARFVILGASYSNHADYEAGLKREAQDLGFELGEDLLIIDPRTYYPDLMQAFDVFWLTSEPRSEGTPTVIEDAMALALPVISTDVGGVSEVVANGLTGILVKPRDVEALALETAALLGDRSRLQSMGQAGRRLAEERFATSACFAAHQHAIQMAIDHHKHRK